MIIIGPDQYHSVGNPTDDEYQIWDHLNGFDINFRNCILTDLNRKSTAWRTLIKTEYLLSDEIKSLYPNLILQFDSNKYKESHCAPVMVEYTQHPSLTFERFLCSFNVKPHVGRQLLVSSLHRFGLWDHDISTKHFVSSKQSIDEHLRFFCGNKDRLYSKFFSTDMGFLSSKIMPDDYVKRMDLAPIQEDLEFLVSKITRSFIHLVSETVSETYLPFITEKFLFSVISRGLFLSYAPPGWHKILSAKLGFRLYDNLFDYGFDSIINPVERLIALISMINKFRYLSCHDWHDLYLMEQDAIEYNYDHYFSGNYSKILDQIA